jgi:hypothetical protein
MTVAFHLGTQGLRFQKCQKFLEISTRRVTMAGNKVQTGQSDKMRFVR